MSRRKELLSRHPYKIWQGSNGYWYTYLPDKKSARKKKLIEKNSIEKIENVIVEYQKSMEENPTVKEVFDEWNDRKLELKKISGATHMRNKNFFNRHYDQFGNRGIKDISEDEWLDFIEEQIPRFNLTAKAFAGFKGVTKGLLKRARRRGLTDINVEMLMSDIDVDEADFNRTVKEDSEEVFNEEEMSTIIEYLIDHLDLLNMCILLIFISGMRVGEVTALKHEDFDEKSCFIRVRRTESREVRNGVVTEFIKDFPKTLAGVRDIVIPVQWRWLVKRLWLLSAEKVFVFERDEDHTRYDTQSVRRRLGRICGKLGIKPKSPHKIRKTYGSILLDNGVDRRTILDQMGHSSIGVTERNYHRNRKTIDDKAEKLSAIADFGVRNVLDPTPENEKSLISQAL